MARTLKRTTGRDQFRCDSCAEAGLPAWHRYARYTDGTITLCPACMAREESFDRPLFVSDDTEA